MSLFPSFDYKTPGQYIDDLLVQRGWSRRVLAIVLGCEESIINKIIASTRRVDAKMAIHLGEVFDVEADKFLELQKIYDLAHARSKERPDPTRTARAHLFGSLPVPEMIKRGWINVENIRDVASVQSELTRFFKANSAEEIEIMPLAAKRTRVNTEPSHAQLAWLYRVKEISEEMLVSKYSPNAVLAAVDKLAALRASADGVRNVPRILQDAGIRFVIVEPLAGSGIDGVCLWINKTSPVIGMSLRHDRIDNFWFVLRHEIEHVIRLHGQSAMMLDTELEGPKAGVGPNVPEEERVANTAAAEFCVPQRSLEQFIARKSPVFAERDILGFANTLKVHPGLVAGQIRFKTGLYTRLHDYLVKVRSILPTSPFMDGWGDVAPVGD